MNQEELIRYAVQITAAVNTLPIDIIDALSQETGIEYEELTQIIQQISEVHEQW